MAWDERINTASITSPSGFRKEFLYENVETTTALKTGAFIFPEVDGQYVQHMGRGGRSFPLTMFFSGPDCDIDSDLFLAALEEKGIFKLEHPKYGVRNVVPTGEIHRSDGLVSEANTVIFTVVFSETILDITFPSSDLNEKSDIQESVSNLDASISDQYADNLDIQSESETAILQNDIIEKKDLLTESLDSLTQLNEDIANATKTIGDSVNNSVLNLVIGPGGIADQILTLINVPANIAAPFDSYSGGYGGVIDSITGSVNDTGNKYWNALLFVGGAIGGLFLSTLNALFTNRPDAIKALEKLGDLNDTIKDWMDNSITDLGIIDTGEIYSSLNSAFSKICGYLVRLSFDLPKRIYLTLTEDRNIIELVSEIYGDIDRIDFFIETNDLTTDEIELLPRGKEVVYFE
jgi:hypothetical protein